MRALIRNIRPAKILKASRSDDRAQPGGRISSLCSLTRLTASRGRRFLCDAPAQGSACDQCEKNNMSAFLEMHGFDPPKRNN
jgi:hypothetical protein